MLLLAAALALAVLGSRWPRLASGGVSDVGQTPFYAQTSWASAHRDARNSDFAPFVAPGANRSRATLLDGAATLLAPAIGPEGNRYVTTGRGPGTSHLHAFDADGNLLWESAPQRSLADLDSAALGSSPLVDVAGHVYVSDADQFWSFRSDGRLRWVVPLPPPDDPNAPGAPFLSAILTREGFVGGINTDGKVILFRRQDGRLAVPVFALPKGVPPPSTLERPGLWAGGLVDPRIVRFVEDWFFGDAAQVANTPSVHPRSGRIYITAAGPRDERTQELTGRLYGLDRVDGEIAIAFAAAMGPGSGTSPTISLDGTRVYAADNQGILSAFDAESGERIWATTGVPLAGSPGLGADGTVYAGNPNPDAPATLAALDPADGSVRWQQDYDAFAASLIPALDPLPPLFPSGRPIARVNSVVSSSATRAWVVLTVGYEFVNPLTGLSLSQPRRTVLAAIDPVDGSIRGFSELRDTNEGLISIGPDGTLHVSQAAILSSIHFFAVNPLLQFLRVPDAYRFPGLPLGGVQLLEPISLRDHAREAIGWVRQLAAVALAELSGGDLEAAFTALRRARVQLGATAATLGEARTTAELGATTARAARRQVLRAERLVTGARNLLGRGVVPPPVEVRAARRLERADAVLAGALTTLAR